MQLVFLGCQFQYLWQWLLNKIEEWNSACDHSSKCIRTIRISAQVCLRWFFSVVDCHLLVSDVSEVFGHFVNYNMVLKLNASEPVTWQNWVHCAHVLKALLNYCLLLNLKLLFIRRSSCEEKKHILIPIKCNKYYFTNCSSFL